MTSTSARALLLGVVAALAALAALTARAEIARSATGTGCPEAFQLMSVDALEAQGPYKLARIVDTAGNNDGYVCTRERPDGYAESDCSHGGTIACQLLALGLPVYHFIDNDNPGNGQAQPGG
jgi:hypothetical protein